MEEKEILMTEDGYKEFEAKLDALYARRPDVAKKLETARGFGDLSENAEYDAAKDEQAHLESEINEMEYKKKHIRIIDNSEISSDIVSPGSKVKILDIEFNDEIEYTIVSPSEADIDKNKLSYESPVGKALLNHAVGETVDAETPGGIVKFKILEIRI